VGGTDGKVLNTC